VSRLPGYFRRLGRLAQRDHTLAGDYAAGSIVTADMANATFPNRTLGEPNSNAVPVRHHNFLLNGGMRLAQRGLTISAPTSGDMTLDRWATVYQTSGADVSRSDSTFSTDTRYSMRMSAIAAIGGGKFGVLQILDARRSAQIYANGTGTASLVYRTFNGGSQTITSSGAAILAWDGTVDAMVRSSLVATWGAKGTNPIFGTNWTVEGITAAGSTNVDHATFQKVKLENVSLDTSNTKNIAVFIWNDHVDYDVGDELYLGDIQLETGEGSTHFSELPLEEDLQECQRFYEKTFDADNAPVGAHVSVDPDPLNRPGVNWFHGFGGGRHIHNWDFLVRKNSRPSASDVTWFVTAVLGGASQQDQTGQFSLDTDLISERGMSILSTTAARNSNAMKFHGTCETEIGT